MNEPAESPALVNENFGIPEVGASIHKLNETLSSTSLVIVFRDLYPRKFRSGVKKKIGLPQMAYELVGELQKVLPVMDVDGWDIEEDEILSAIGNNIPLYSITPFEEECMDEWPMAARVLHDLTWGRQTDEGWGELERLVGRPVFRNEFEHIGRVDWQAFDRKMKAVHGGKTFVFAHDVVFHSTGNYFVDADLETIDNDHIEWSTENVRKLKQALNRAEIILKRANKVLLGYSADPERFAKMLEKAGEIISGCVRPRGGENVGDE